MTDFSILSSDELETMAEAGREVEEWERVLRNAPSLEAIVSANGRGRDSHVL